MGPTGGAYGYPSPIDIAKLVIGGATCSERDFWFGADNRVFAPLASRIVLCRMRQAYVVPASWRGVDRNRSSFGVSVLLRGCQGKLLVT